jgi:RNA recognition motif-containing protein
VCFEFPEDANKAYEEFKTSKLFSDELLYVNWAQTRLVRNRKLKEAMNTIANETNLFVKNLKTSVNKQELENMYNIK